ncbi:MAG: hypothetical protein OXN89_03190 [Bryobacterales bacterium]|nr:hypothetical protein [Bryobacterales bacterium]
MALCKQKFSVRGTKARLNASCDHSRLEPTIDRILEEAGFTRLPRHTFAKLWADSPAPIEARCSIRLPPSHSEQLQCAYAAGVLCLLTLLRHFGIDGTIDGVDFPRSANLPPLAS